MPTKVKCHQCGKSLQAPDNLLGKSAPCPGCGATIHVPGPGVPLPVEPEPILDPEPIPDAPTDEYGEIPMAHEYRPTSSVTPGLPPNPNQDDNQPRRPCPRCGEMIPVRAMKCRFCGDIFDPKLKKIEEARHKSMSPDDDMSVGDWILAIICSGIGCIFGIVWLFQGKPKAKKMLLVSIISQLVWGALKAIATSGGR